LLSVVLPRPEAAYSIAKSLIFIVTVNPKLDHPPRLTELGGIVTGHTR
jgi:hypothetical protein